MSGKCRYEEKGYHNRVLDGLMMILEFSPRTWETIIDHESSCPVMNTWGGDECRCFPDIRIRDLKTGEVVWDDPGYEEDEDG